MLTTQTTSAGLTWRSAAMAGSAMLAIAVSSEAIATAQRRSSGGRPSRGAGVGGCAVVSSDIRQGSPRRGAVAPTAACTTDAVQATGTALHDAYAKEQRR